MSKHSSFIIPAGLVFKQGDDGLSIEHQGDVILHDTLGLKLRRVQSAKGDIELHVDADDLTELIAGGNIRIHGAVTANLIRAERIEIHGDAMVDKLEAGAGGIHISGSATAHEISSDATIEISGAAEADVLTASGDVVIGGMASIDRISTNGGNIQLTKVTAKDIASGGDLSINGDLLVDEASAPDGTLWVAGSIKASLLLARTVSVSGEKTEVSAIQAASRITVGGGNIRSDILIAPSISIAPQTSGKITVLETQSDSGPNAVKGCLSLADLEEFGVDTSTYLSSRKLHALGQEPPSNSEPKVEVVAEPEEDTSEGNPFTIETFDEEDLAEFELSNDTHDTDTFSIVGGPKEEVPASTLAISAAVSAENELEALECSDVDDDDDESEEVGAEVLSLKPNDSAEPLNDPIHDQLRDTIAQIASCYEGSELPPAINQLGRLANAREYVAIRDDITNIWHQLLKFHQKRGLRIQPQVTTTFNTINTLVRKF
jgi:hypothetical protein